MTDQDLPAWSEPFMRGASGQPRAAAGVRRIDREWAWGGATGAGVKVAIIDSGVEGSHPVVGGRLVESVAVEIVDDEATVVPDEAVDLYGHATACAGIIVGLAPEVEIYSVRVLGADLRGKGVAFLAGLEWAVEQGVQAMNLSLSSKSERLFPFFHEIGRRRLLQARRAGLRGQQRARPVVPVDVLIGLLGRRPRRGRIRRPSSTTRRRRSSGAPGASTCRWLEGWRNDRRHGQQLRRAAHGRPGGPDPSKHPGLTPFEIKAVLAAIANNPQPEF